LAGNPSIDYVILRENTEGLYASRNGGVEVHGQVATDTMIITKYGTERITKYAFELARQRNLKKTVTCVDKANVLQSMAFWRKCFNNVADHYPDIQKNYVYTDAMAFMQIVRPHLFDVVVAENMFGDIISDLGAGTIGGMGIAPSADLGDEFGLFQPVHGTAPDIAGKGIANPVGQILSVGMMLEWLGQQNKDADCMSAAKAIEEAVGSMLLNPQHHTTDLGGTAKTVDIGNAVVNELRKKSSTK